MKQAIVLQNTVKKTDEECQPVLDEATAIELNIEILRRHARASSLHSPGEGVNAVASSDFVPKEAPPIKETLINIFPTNPVAAMAEGNMLQVIVFALLVGFALTRAGAAGERLIAWFQDMEVVVMKMVGVLI